MNREIKILIADDDSIASEILGRMLSNAGHSITYVKNGEEALLAAQQENFATILMDMGMPEMSGEEATKTLTYYGNKAKVIAVTAKKMSHGQLVQLGITEIVAKPVDFKSLSQAIERAIKISTPHDQA